LNIKTKVGSSWVDPVPSVNVAGTWTKVKKAYSKVDTGWEVAYEYESVYTFRAGYYTDVDLDSLGLDKYHNVRVVIPSDVNLYSSSTNAYALKTGEGYTGILTIENNGIILGRGGDAGDGGHAYANNTGSGGNGSDGGSAILIESNVTIMNTGTILGGGGGGGGGAGIHNHQGGFYSPDYSGGGGGGGGAPYGLGGSGGDSSGPNGGAGAAATSTIAGAGGDATQHDHVRGGYGGTGGTRSVAGSDASDVWYSDYTSFGSKGLGGAAGAAYYNPSSFTIS